MRKDLIRQFVTIVSVVLVIVVNGLANALPINGQQTGEISDRFPVYFVPAGYVFSIWGLIYLGLIAFTIYQALPGQRSNDRLRRVGYWFALSCLANAAWIFLWHYNLFPRSLAVMLVILACLLMVYLRLGIGQAAAGALEKWVVNAPFSVYLGWITVATVANATSVLYDLRWSGWGIGPAAWAALMIVVATAICLGVIVTRRDSAYALVLVWAFAGITVKQLERSALVGAVAAVMAVAIVVALVWFRWVAPQTRLSARPA